MGLRFSNTSNLYATFTAGNYDPTVQAFFSVASISNPTQRRAVDTLVNDLKVYNIWNKMRALYPFVGGNANAHKFNLKDPRDITSAFALTFSGSWTHTSTGAKPDGTTAYASTNLIPTSSLTSGNTHLAVYNRTNVAAAISIGMITGYGSPDTRWLLNDYTNVMYSDHYQYNANRLTTGISDYRGFWMTNRVSDSHIIYRNGALSNSQTTSPAGFSGLTQAVFLQAYSFIGSSTVAGYANGEVAFASIGEGLTATEASNYYTAVQAFQSTLGRQV